MGIGFINLNRVKGRLYAAFGTATLLTIAAGGVALQGFGSVEGHFQSVIGRSIPTMETALELSRGSALLSAAAPNLAAARSVEESNKTMAGLEQRLSQIQGLIQELESATGSGASPEHIESAGESEEKTSEQAEPEAVADEPQQTPQTASQVTTELRPLLEQFQTYLKTLNSEVNASLKADAKLVTVAKQVSKTHEDILAQIAPVLKQAVTEVGKGSATLSIGGVKAVNNLMNSDLPHLIQLHEIETLSQRISGALALSQNADTSIASGAISSISNIKVAMDKTLGALLKKQKLPDVKNGVDGFVKSVASGDLSGAQRTLESLQVILDTSKKVAHKKLGKAMQDFMIANSVSGSTLVNTKVKTVITLLKIESKANRAAGLLAIAVNINDISTISKLQEDILLAVRQTIFEIGELKDKALLAQLSEASANFNALAEGDSGISALRRVSLEAKSNASAALKNTQQVSELLSSTVDEIVNISKSEVESGSEDIVAAFKSSKQFLLIIIGLSIVIAALIAWLYVGRKLGRRLDELTTTTKAVADGNLDVDISISGKDEIADMGSALLIFKDSLTQAK